jgi:hypothetical protein
MSMFYQIENAENINKIYGDGPFPSGYELIPYTLGSHNKYAPKPFGLKLRSELYSVFAQSNIHLAVEPGLARSLWPGHASNDITFSQPEPSPDDRNWISYGPVAAVYEIELSGVESKDGGCRRCEDMNGKYYAYLVPGQTYIVSTKDAHRMIGKYYDGRINWHGKICDLNRPVNLCDFNMINMTISHEKIAIDNTHIGSNQTSGNVIVAVDFIRYVRNVYDENGLQLTALGANKWRFLKNFGDMQALDFKQISRKPNMLSEITLLPSGTPNYGFQAPLYNPIAPTGDTTYGDFECNLANAVCLIRPYQSGRYDPKSTMSAFYNISYMGLINYDNVLNPYHEEYKLYNQDSDIVFDAPDSYFCRNYYQDNLNIEFLTGVTDERNNRFFPPSFQLSFNDITNLECSGLSNCIPCSEFYRKPKILHGDPIFGVGGSPSNQYGWASTAVYETLFDESYYNICNNGCNSLGNLIDGRRDYFDNGPCNNFIIFNHSNEFLASPSSIVTGYIYFGAIFASGGTDVNPTFVKYYSNKRLKKKLCDSSTDNKCNGSGNFQAGRWINVSGMVNCFDSEFYSSGWALESQTTLTPLLPENLDITNYCDFSAGKARLEVPRNPMLPCASPPCAICGEDRVAQSVSVTVFIDAPSPSGVNRTFILSREGDEYPNWGREHYYLSASPAGGDK